MLQHRRYESTAQGLGAMGYGGAARPNAFFEAQFEAQLSEADGAIGIFMLDFDRFSLVNDVLGAHVGQELLQSAKARLEAVIGDCVLAYTQDYKILIAVPEQPGQGAFVTLAEKVLHICRQPWTIRKQTCFFTASIGASFFPHDSRDVARLIQYADIARLRAKELGGDNYQFYTENLSAQALRELELEKKLRLAVDRRELFLHYQSRVDLRQGAIGSLEALARWKNKELGLVPPAAFIPVAERSGLILTIGEWVLKEVCRQLHTWRKQQKSVKVSVNLSAAQLYYKNFVPDTLAVLRQYDIATGQLEFEVTENAVLRDLDYAVYVLKEIRKSGAAIAMDDFGTGQSSLAHLGRLPVDVLKIDKSFIQAMNDSEENVSIVQTIVALGHLLRQKVTAEGVETEQQLALLRRFGCDEIQGYFFSRPVSPEAAYRLLVEGNAPLLRLRRQLALEPSCL